MPLQLYQAFKKHQIAQWGIGVTLFATPTFWLNIVLVYIIIASLRIAERAVHSIWRPTDVEILAENEHLEARNGGPMSHKARRQDEIELQQQEGLAGDELSASDDFSYHRDPSAAENGEYAPNAKLQNFGLSKKNVHERDSSDERWLQ